MEFSFLDIVRNVAYPCISFILWSSVSALHVVTNVSEENLVAVFRALCGDKAFFIIHMQNYQHLNQEGHNLNPHRRQSLSNFLRNNFNCC
jgi:hypothetical protein